MTIANGMFNIVKSLVIHSPSGYWTPCETCGSTAQAHPGRSGERACDEYQGRFIMNEAEKGILGGLRESIKADIDGSRLVELCRVYKVGLLREFSGGYDLSYNNTLQTFHINKYYSNHREDLIALISLCAKHMGAHYVYCYDVKIPNEMEFWVID